MEWGSHVHICTASGKRRNMALWQIAQLQAISCIYSWPCLYCFPVTVWNCNCIKCYWSGGWSVSLLQSRTCGAAVGHVQEGRNAGRCHALSDFYGPHATGTRWGPVHRPLVVHTHRICPCSTSGVQGWFSGDTGEWFKRSTVQNKQAVCPDSIHKPRNHAPNRS